MNLQVILVLCILTFMVISLLMHKLPFGVTGMLCCALFVVTGLADMQTAFSGLSSPNTIMVASMVALASMLGRTSLILKLRRAMGHLQGKKGIILVLFMFFICIALSQLMGQMACITIMLIFLQTLDEESDISPARMLFAIICINSFWTARIPVGMGAAFSGMINGMYQGLVTNDAQLIGFTDYCKAGLIPSIVGTLYCLFFYVLVPKSQIVKEKVRDAREIETYSKRDEMMVFIVFVVVMIGFMFKDQIGSDISNVLPVIGILLLIITNVVSKEEVLKIVTGDIIWMVAGISVMSTILAQTGVGELIGKFVLSLLGTNPSGIWVCIVFSVVACVMTNFLSNFGTMGVLCPIAASTAIAGGMNVKAVVLAVALSAWLTAFVMPMASSAAIMGYGVGNYNPGKVFKFTLPLVALVLVSTVFSVNLFFPIYG